MRWWVGRNESDAEGEWVEDGLSVKEAFADCLRQGMTKEQEASVLALYQAMKGELSGAAGEASLGGQSGMVSPDTPSGPAESVGGESLADTTAEIHEEGRPLTDDRPDLGERILGWLSGAADRWAPSSSGDRELTTSEPSSGPAESVPDTPSRERWLISRTQGFSSSTQHPEYIEITGPDCKDVVVVRESSLNAALARAEEAERERDRYDDEAERLGVLKEEYRLDLEAAESKADKLEALAAGQAATIERIREYCQGRIDAQTETTLPLSASPFYILSLLDPKGV